MKGSCLRGAVRFEIDRLDGPIVHCPCRTCQKAHAAAIPSYPYTEWPPGPR